MRFYSSSNYKQLTNRTINFFCCQLSRYGHKVLQRTKLKEGLKESNFLNFATMQTLKH